MTNIDTDYLSFLATHREWTHEKVGAFQRYKNKQDGWHHFDINIISEIENHQLQIIFCNHFLTNFATVKKDDTNPTSIHLFDTVTSRFLDIKESPHLSISAFVKNLDDKFKKTDLKGVIFTFEPALDEYEILID